MKQMISLALTLTIVALPARADDLSLSPTEVFDHFSLEAQAVIEDINKLHNLTKNENAPTVELDLESGEFFDASQLKNPLASEMEKDCLIYGEGSFCKSKGIAPQLAELPAYEYNLILTHWLIPRYIEDLNFQMTVDQFYPIHQQWIQSQQQTEDVSLSAGGRIVDGAVLGVSAFLSVRGVKALVDNRARLAQWFKVKAQNRNQLPMIVSTSQSTALTKVRPASFWSTRSGIYTQIGIAAVTGATCRSISNCGFDVQSYRANMMLALQLTQTEMACQMTAKATELTQNIKSGSTSVQSELKVEGQELLNRMLYLFASQTHLQHYKRDPLDKNGSFQAQVASLTRADGWFQNFQSICPEAKLAESYFELLTAMEEAP